MTVLWARGPRYPLSRSLSLPVFPSQVRVGFLASPGPAPPPSLWPEPGGPLAAAPAAGSPGPAETG